MLARLAELYTPNELRLLRAQCRGRQNNPLRAPILDFNHPPSPLGRANGVVGEEIQMPPGFTGPFLESERLRRPSVSTTRFPRVAGDYDSW
jgi:hypothetical protein